MLKKIAILTAAAGMLSASMVALAEGPTVYGRVAFGMKSVSGETNDKDKQRIDDNLGSQIGVKGTNDLGNGMSVDYLLEYQTNKNTDGSLKLRHSNITLNGGFGQFRLGQQTGVLYRYIGANTDQSWGLGGSEWYAIAGASGTNLHSDHSLRMKNIAAYRFGSGPGGDDPITFDIQVQSMDRTEGLKAVPVYDEYTGLTTPVETSGYTEVKDDESIDSVTIGAATALGPVKLQLAYMTENGSLSYKDGDGEKGTVSRDPSLVSFGFRAPLGSAEIRGHMTEVDADLDGRDDNEAWGLLVMNDFGGGYSGMIGVGSYTDGGKAVAAKDGTTIDSVEVDAVSPIHQNAGDQTNVYVSLTKSFGGGLSAVAEYSTVSVTKTKLGAGTDGEIGTQGAGASGTNDDVANDDKEKTNTFLLSLVQSF